jgi:aminoglycoside 6'-N-acetyltransferase I
MWACAEVGVGTAVMAAGERWAKGRGCREFASDTPLENAVSERAHRALGFEETSRVVNFRTDLA